MLAVKQIAAVDEELIAEALGALPAKARADADRELKEARLLLARLARLAA